MAVQPPLPKIKTSGGQSPLKISPTNTAATVSATPSMSTMSTAPKQSTPMAAGAGETTQPGSLSNPMSGQTDPKSKKWLWILIGLFGFLAVLAIGIGLYLWLR